MDEQTPQQTDTTTPTVASVDAAKVGNHSQWWWGILAIAALLAIALWVAWVKAWFPFSHTNAPIVNESPQSLQDTLGSLTATSTTTLTKDEESHTINSLTPPSSAQKTNPSADAVLNGLTAPSTSSQ